jgi:hypothetical protein
MGRPGKDRIQKESISNFAPYEPLNYSTHHIIIYLPMLHLSHRL